MDHIFPEAWYPTTTPQNMEKWKAPSCVPCNSAHGKVEDDLLRRIGLCMSSSEMAAAGIPEKALRSIRPQHGKNDRDKRARAAARDKLRKEVAVLDKPPEGTFPNFGPQPGTVYDKYLRIWIPQEGLFKLGRKIVRGLSYLLEDRLLPDDNSIEIFFVEDHVSADLLASVRPAGKIHHRGPGIIVERAVAADDAAISLWHITILGRLKMWAAVNVNPDAKSPPAAASATT
jgi:hypothetical protein